MVIYLDLVMLLNFAVDLLLLLGTNYLVDKRSSWPRMLIAAAVGGVYGGVCLLPGFSFLGNTFWRLIFLVLMAVMAFGFGVDALRRGVLFVLLSMALGGIALGLGQGGWLALLAAAGALTGLCALGFRRGTMERQLMRAELDLAGQKKQLMALHDTGNTLRDPITGCSVLVVDPDVAWELLGLTDVQLASPADTLASAGIPGLRLIPYRSVGQPGGLLLGIRVDSLKIDGKVRDPIVAFAPHKLGNGGYQALAGGIM
jgi:stage II sporulation protein GA (sporulation sigma-E factor processing peptidase)